MSSVSSNLLSSLYSQLLISFVSFKFFQPFLSTIVDVLYFLKIPSALFIHVCWCSLFPRNSFNPLHLHLLIFSISSIFFHPSSFTFVDILCFLKFFLISSFFLVDIFCFLKSPLISSSTIVDVLFFSTLFSSLYL